MDNKEQNPIVFRQRLDFYWQYIGAYSILVIVYAVIFGSYREGRLSIKFNEPFVLLLIGFILYSLFSWLINLYMRREIVIGDDYFVFKTRFGTKKFTSDNVSRIKIVKQLLNRRELDYRSIRIISGDYKRRIRIRTSAFEDQGNLLEHIREFKRKWKK
ncbi:MAG: hypothetical protein ACM3U1_07145 [Chloroflexota bacterium]